MRGACYVAYGPKAEREAGGAVRALQRYHPDLRFTVRSELVQALGLSHPKQQARYAKLTLLDWTPYEHTCYMDADTRLVDRIDAGFDALSHGWEFVISPSLNQDGDWLWHVGDEERECTEREIGFRPLQLQAGMFFVRDCEATRALFDRWLEEYLRFRDEDQGALLRALYRSPAKTLVLGTDWHGGTVLHHRWGSIRRG